MSGRVPPQNRSAKPLRVVPFPGTVMPDPVKDRLDHELSKPRSTDEPNDEARGIAWLYHHASTRMRAKLYDVIQANECDCFGCLSVRRDLEREFEATEEGGTR
jgi:hypothetical protein